MASYLFPAGGQRGTTVKIRAGGLFLHKSCSFELLGPGVEASKVLHRTRTVWFEGPVLPLPDSQQAEDYPHDMAGEVRIAADAPLGPRRGRLWTSEGAASGLAFVVGDLPEVVEDETDGDPVPVDVRLPVTANGRIFPREDVDAWSFTAHKGQTITAEVHAARIGSPLDSRLRVVDTQGRVLAENDDALGPDSQVHFTAPADGTYRVQIDDANRRGGQNYVYRLTLTTGPHVDRVYPLGGRRGSKVRFTLQGQGVPGDPVEVILPAGGPRDYRQRFPVGGQPSNPVRLDLDDLPEHVEAEPNDEAAQARLVPLPAVANGRIDRPGDVDCWRFTARKGQALALELRAQQLGSPLQGVLRVCDAVGKELARSGEAGNAPDPALAFTAPADGTYCVRVADRFRTRGGPAFAYRLRLAPPAAAVPDFRLHLAADVLTLRRPGTVKLRINAERLGGLSEAIPLTVEGLPAGVRVTNTTIPARQGATEVTLQAEASAPIGGVRLTIRGTAVAGGRSLTRTATLPATGEVPESDSVLLGVALAAPFKIAGSFDLRLAPRGSVFRRRYKIDRGGFTGPLEVSLADRQARHLQGVTGPTVVVPPGASEFEYAVQLPPWMETGRTSRSCIMLVGVLKEGNVEHAVSTTSINQNDQVIAVVETGRLGVEAERSSVPAVRGGSVAVPVKVSRDKGLLGPVKLELIAPAHMHGLRAAPVVIPADQSRGTFTVGFGAEALGPFNMPVLLRATLDGPAGPVVAETKLEVVPED